MNINEEIQNILLNIDNRKIKEQSLEEYLNSFKKNELFEILSLHINSSKDVIGMYVLKEKSKRKLIEYICDNLKDILKIHLKYMKIESLNFLKDILPTIKEKNYDITDKKIPITFASYFKKFHLAIFEYDEESIKFFMPKKFIQTFEELINESNTIKENLKNNELFNYIYNITNAYGIIDLNTLYKFVNENLYKIEKEEFINKLNLFEISDDYLHIYEYNDEKIVCNIEFQTEDMAINFYNRQTEDYKKYSLDELKLIGDNKYVENLSSYNKFIEYLNSIFDLTEEDTKYITDFLIMNYIYSANISKDEADKGFKMNASSMFDLEDSEIEDMRKIAEKIFKDYPKWIKRGNI